ncbi:e5ddae37-a4fc-4505-94b0-79470eaf478e [Sclerotinia trifoliorum]|uniref:E5ddae37-a4fc-4505-94b0-79470eaf478e n=1 Tax=Sclerotinia trifoliorum TaxID=28548 RepID=A0A8H2ZPW8_9HELO|nr:e5ddae37-a4fc-4505-94b0-79470eaf478e [Sclerotinia trifoliorum]
MDPSINPPPTDEELLLKVQMKAWRKQQHEALKLESRMSIPYGARLPLCTSISFVCGMALGISHGSKTAALRFRAENAHRLPTSPTGWYLYHKSKNYHTGLGGVKEGLKMGTRIAFWTAGLLAIEDMCDRWRGRKDVLNTVVASLSVAGGFSLWNRFPITTAARTAKTGLVFGIGYGLVQDAVGYARGRRLGYVDFLMGAGRRGEEESRHERTTI